jgi:hypothetical protein
MVIGERSWLNKVRETKAIWGVKEEGGFRRQKVTNDPMATTKGEVKLTVSMMLRVENGAKAIYSIYYIII